MAYVLIDFFIFFAIIITYLLKAIQVNYLDHELQKFYSNLLRHVTCVREMAERRTFFEKDNNIELLLKQSDGNWLRVKDGSVLQTTKGFRDVNRKVLAKLDDVKDKTETATAMVNHLLKHEQIRFFNQDVHLSLIYTLLTSTGTICVVLLQEIIGQLRG